MKTWYEMYPKRLDEELSALQAASVAYSIDEDARRMGILRLHLSIDRNNPFFDLTDTDDLHLVVVYPDHYPFFRPEVYAEYLDLPRHQNPFGKNLCLLPRATSFWYPTSTVASYLKDQLRKVIVQGEITDPNVLAGLPEEQGEPVSEYYPAEPDSPVIFDPSVLLPDFSKPGIELIGKTRVGIPEPSFLPGRMLIKEIMDVNGKRLSQLPSDIAKFYPSSITGLLYQIPKAPPFGNPQKDFDWFIEQLKKENRRINYSPALRLKDGKMLKHVIGFCFPEEKGVSEIGPGWLFIVVMSFKKEAPGSTKKKPVFANFDQFYYAKVSRISSSDFALRIPKLAALRNSTISLAGLGALGAPLAIELAKNGVKTLRLLDFDVVETATTVRWPLGFEAAGKYKIDALKKFINENYPFTTVETFDLKLGGPRLIYTGNTPYPNTHESDTIDSFLENTSLLIDCTAEEGVMHFLSYKARELKVPFISGYATEGAAGGLVMRQVPGLTPGCWMCMRHHQLEGSIPIPTSDNSGKIQPAGCGDTTFAGAGFDLHNVTSAIARVACGILCRSDPNGYPLMHGDVSVLALKDDGAPCLPAWSEHILSVHPQCPYCNG